uniref:GH18 domain-containing protein n=1 Tax=Magallana gigas TaxID=29159 RepID=A0A8W8M3U7_MAGGI
MNTIILASLLVLLVSLTEIHGEFIKMCYYSAWAAYRDGDQALKPEDVDAHHCTHLALAYGTIDASGKRVKFPDVFEDMHLPERMNSLRDHNEDLNMVLSVGGWMMDSEAWSNMLVLGIPYYGRSFRLQNPNMTMPGAPALGPGSDGGEGIPVNKICHLIRGGVQEQYIPEQKVPYFVMGDEWVGFDNLRSVREKAMLVASNHLGGVALWTLDQDDHRGVCGEKWSITFEVIHGLGRAEYVDYVAAKQESLRTLINHKIVHTSKEIGYYSDVQNSTMAARKEAELEQLQNDLATLQDQQQKQWMQVQRSATLGGKAIPPLDQPSWKL